MQTLKLAKLVQIKIDTAISEAINEQLACPGRPGPVRCRALHARVEPAESPCGGRDSCESRQTGNHHHPGPILHLILFNVYDQPGGINVKAGVIKA